MYVGCASDYKTIWGLHLDVEYVLKLVIPSCYKIMVLRIVKKGINHFCKQCPHLVLK